MNKAIQFAIALTCTFPLHAATTEKPKVVIVNVSPRAKAISKAVQDRADKLRACNVDVQTISGSTPAELQEKIELDVKPSTLALIEGHGVRLYEEKDRSVHFYFANVEDEESISADMNAVKFLPLREVAPSKMQAVVNKYSNLLHDPQKLLSSVAKKAKASLWVDACHGGSCIRDGICVGTSCSAEEISYEDNFVSNSLTNLLCSAAGDCKLFNATDTDGNGCIDGPEFLKQLNPSEKKEQIQRIVDSGDSAALKLVEQELNTKYSQVKATSKKSLGVYAKLEFHNTEIRQQYESEITDADFQHVEGYTPYWLRDYMPWAMKFSGNYADCDEAKKTWAELTRKNNVSFPRRVLFKDNDDAMVGVIKSAEVKCTPPQTEHSFEVTSRPVLAHQQKQFGEDVTASPLFNNFSLCWHSCKTPGDRKPSPEQEAHRGIRSINGHFLW